MSNNLQHKFVQTIPEHIESGVLYISTEFRMSSHKCGCGCGERIDILFSPTDWELIFNGETVSIYPSIGNWNYKCQSHYYITENKFVFAPKWTKKQISDGRKRDLHRKDKHYSNDKQKTLKNRLRKFFGLSKNK